MSDIVLLCRQLHLDSKDASLRYKLEGNMFIGLVDIYNFSIHVDIISLYMDNE